MSSTAVMKVPVGHALLLSQYGPSLSQSLPAPLGGQSRKPQSNRTRMIRRFSAPTVSCARTRRGFSCVRVHDREAGAQQAERVHEPQQDLRPPLQTSP